MIALIQRVSEAQVRVDGALVGAIERGMLALIGVRRGDEEPCAERLLERLLAYRIFPDAQGRMNLSLREVGGRAAARAAVHPRGGHRKEARARASARRPRRRTRAAVRAAASTRAGAKPMPLFPQAYLERDMQVSLINDGPVTFWLETPAGRA